MAYHYTCTTELETQLLPESRAESFVRTRRTVVGDDLRSAAYFMHDHCEQVYLRNNLEADADLTGFVEHETDGFQARVAYRGSELGDYRYTVYAFGYGYLARVTVGNKGVLVTADSLTLRRSEELASAFGELLRKWRKSNGIEPNRRNAQKDATATV